MEPPPTLVCRPKLRLELVLEVVDEAELLVFRLMEVTVKTPLDVCELDFMLLVAETAVVDEVGDCGECKCSGDRLPSEPSLECDEGGVRGKPYVFTLVFVREGLDTTNVPALDVLVSDLIVIFGIITFWALELKIKGCVLSRVCEEGVNCRQPS